MIGMCASASDRQCLHLAISNRTTLFGFYRVDCLGRTILNTDQWYHFAFVYDYPNRTQFIYLNGVLECNRTPAEPFLGNSGVIIIGAVNMTSVSPQSYWTGYIDQVSYVSRAKTEIEILTDATLVAYYSFDNGSCNDLGPNNLNGVSQMMKND